MAITTVSRRGLFALATAAAMPANAGLLKFSAAIDPALRNRALASLARHKGRVADASVIAIADYAAKSGDRRFHLLDMNSGAVASYLVAHGRGSDPAHSGWLQRFSNQDGSYASCDGAFVTGAEYYGKHGRSQRLVGLDASNCNAEPRAIVIHSAPYVSEGMARDLGKVGRSQGCFTLTAEALPEVMQRLGPGRFLYADKA